MTVKSLLEELRGLVRFALARDVVELGLPDAGDILIQVNSLYAVVSGLVELRVVIRDVRREYRVMDTLYVDCYSDAVSMYPEFWDRIKPKILAHYDDALTHPFVD